VRLVFIAVVTSIGNSLKPPPGARVSGKTIRTPTLGINASNMEAMDYPYIAKVGTRTSFTIFRASFPNSDIISDVV
jgi:hypothetical protein